MHYKINKKTDAFVVEFVSVYKNYKHDGVVVDRWKRSKADEGEKKQRHTYEANNSPFCIAF